MASQLEAKLQSAEAELAIIQSEYSDAIQTHLSNTMVKCLRTCAGCNIGMKN